MARRSQSRSRSNPVRSGPWRGVNDSLDPFEGAGQYLYDAQNCYIPDPARGSAVLARPGWKCLNPGAALGAGLVRHGQGIFSIVDSAPPAAPGTLRTFLFVGGKVYRWSGSVAFPTFTDVTPVGVTIAMDSWIYCVAINGKLVVSDGTNRPWVGTNLGSTPITATAIQYNTAANPWAAYGQPTIIGGSLFFIALTLNTVLARTTILWSEPDDPAIGYLQDGFDNSWELEQTSNDPLYAIVGDNTGFTYFRGNSIGRVDGVVREAFVAASSHDNVSSEIGLAVPISGNGAGVTTSSSGLWFTDQTGLIRQLPPGGQPLDTWKQLRQLSALGNFTNAGGSTFATYYSALDLVLICWQPNVGSTYSFSNMYMFSASSGTYLGSWTLPGGAPPHIVAEGRDVSGLPVLLALGSSGIDISTGGFVYVLRKPSDNWWTDIDHTGTTVLPTRSATPRLLVDTDDEVRFDTVSVVTMSSAQMQLAYTTPRTASTIATAAVPSLSQDGSFRASWGTKAIGREARFKVTPTEAVTTQGAQWGLQALSASIVPVGVSPKAP
jgi:hypothetical protein